MTVSLQASSSHSSACSKVVTCYKVWPSAATRLTGSIPTLGVRWTGEMLRKTLLKYKLHTDQDLFDRAYAYIRQYY